MSAITFGIDQFTNTQIQGFNLLMVQCSATLDNGIWTVNTSYPNGDKTSSQLLDQNTAMIIVCTTLASNNISAPANTNVLANTVTAVANTTTALGT